jgi:lysophospholipase L1-like esterase
MIALDTVAKAALAPLLIAQARHVRRTALIMPEPAGRRSGGTGPHRLLILGDSSAAGVGASHQDEGLSGCLARQLGPAVAWQLEAKTGATTASSLAHLDRLQGARFNTALVVLGVNDVTHMVTLRRLLAQRHSLYRRLQDDFGVARIVISGLPPMGHFPLLPHPLRWVLGQQSARFDQALAHHAQQLGHHYLRHHIRFDPAYMAPDGFHPGPRAYQLWACSLAPALQP